MDNNIIGKPTFGIIKEVSRPPAEKIEALSKYPVAVIGDAIGRRSVMDAGIKPLSPDMKMWGPAVTVEVHVGDNLMIHAAVAAIVQPGDVLVVNGHGNTRNGIWGDIINTAAQARGVAGVIIDGAVRDSVELRDSGMPVFTRAINPCGGFKEGPGQVNFTISCGGVTVSPGDIVLGDGDGVVVVPKDWLDNALKEAHLASEKEARRLAAIKKGDVYPSWLIPTLREKGVLGSEEDL